MQKVYTDKEKLHILIQKEFDRFFEFPTDKKDTVSSVSCRLFAFHIAEIVDNKNKSKIVD